MRDDFPQSMKKKLAERVAWRCSFPGCDRITIGPSHKSAEDTINLGEAAHIHAASEKGPRYNPDMSHEQRKSINNAIWMCRPHARMIDSDYTIYSASTIKQWKIIAEKKTYQQLKELSKSPIDIPLTFVSLGSKIIFEGLWKSVKNNNWIFEIRNFFVGNIDDIKEFSTSIGRAAFNNYVIVESQGDGRLLDKEFSWNYIDDKYEIEVSVQEKQTREDPNNVGGDIAVGEYGDLKIEDGDLKIITGVECAKQLISNTLSIGFGELFNAPTFGSYFSDYYWKFKDNPQLVNRLLKLEITRLVSIPTYEPDNPTPKPPLNFINRIIEVEIIDIEVYRNRIPVRLKVEWGNGEIWEDQIKIYIHADSR